MHGYTYKTNSFEGPLDLLLSLIEKHELDITQVNLSQVTAEYLSHVQDMQQLAPAYAADFLVVAAKLILIKSKALLPTLELSEEEEEGVVDLEARLKEYRKFKEAGKTFADMLARGQVMFEREGERMGQDLFLPPAQVTLTQLAELFATVLGDVPHDLLLPEENIEDTVTIGEKMDFIHRAIEKSMSVDFSKVHLDARGKTDVIVSFLAMLELVKQRVIDVEQSGLFANITITKRAEHSQKNI